MMFSEENLKVIGADINEILLKNEKNKDNINNEKKYTLMTIGENIKKYRKEKGLTQKELAEKCNISRSYLADLELNRYNPSLDTLNIIADNLDVKISTLLGEDNSHKKNIYDELEKEFPEGLHLLARANKELTEKEKDLMIKIMKTFFNDSFT